MKTLSILAIYSVLLAVVVAILMALVLFVVGIDELAVVVEVAAAVFKV